MEGMPNNNQQSGNKLTPQQQYMMAQKQAYMQRMRQQQYLYQQKMMQQKMAQQNQGFVKQTMQSPQQVANQMNKQNVNPMQNANVGFVNQPVNNSPEYNFYRFNQQPANQNDFANKSQVKIQWKFDEGAKQSVPTQQAQQPVQEQQAQALQQEPAQQNFQAVQQPQVQTQMQQPIVKDEQVEEQKDLQEKTIEEIAEETFEDLISEDKKTLEGLKIEYDGKIYDLENMSLEEIIDFEDKVLQDREEAIAEINMILTRDPSINPVRLEDFPYYEMLKAIQKGV